MKYRTPPRYNTSEAVEVMVNDTKCFVFLEAEIVVQEVHARGGKIILRRVTSRAMETTALIKASDKFNTII